MNTKTGKAKEKTYIQPESNLRLKAVAKRLSFFVMHVFYRTSYEGLENIPQDQPFILVANHTGIMDIPALHNGFENWMHWVAKKELFEIPVIGGLLRRFGAIPVDRESVDMSAARNIFVLLKSGHPIGMFPQGTRVKHEDIQLVKPKTGVVHFAIKTGVPILPAAINHKMKIFRPNKVIIGPPFKLTNTVSGKYSRQELQDMGTLVMQKIYKLIDYSYEPQAEPQTRPSTTHAGPAEIDESQQRN